MRFDQNKVSDLRSIWEGQGTEARLDAGQEAMIRELAELVAPRIGLDPIPCRGAWLTAVRRYQAANARAASEVTKAAPIDRMRAAGEIRDHFRDVMAEILGDKRRQAELDAALAAAFALYVEKYNRR